MSEHIIRTTNMPSHVMEALSAWYEVNEEIVRCKGCKHSYEDRRCTSTGWVDVLLCESKQWSTSSLMPNHAVKDDGFCAWGKRRES